MNCKYCGKGIDFVIKDAVPTEVSGERDETQEDVYRMISVCGEHYDDGIRDILKGSFLGWPLVDDYTRKDIEPRRDFERTMELIGRIREVQG